MENIEYVSINREKEKDGEPSTVNNYIPPVRI